MKQTIALMLLITISSAFSSLKASEVHCNNVTNEELKQHAYELFRVSDYYEGRRICRGVKYIKDCLYRVEFIYGWWDTWYTYFIEVNEETGELEVVRQFEDGE